MKKSLGIALIGTMATLALFANCGAGRTGEPAEPQVELRVYQVPVEQRDSVRSLLLRSLEGDEPVGRVTNGPSLDSVVVVAPPLIHAGVAQLLEDLGKIEPAAAPQPVTLAYWLLVGRSLDSPPAGDRSFAVRGKRSLAEIRDVLQQIAESQGPIEFHLLERVQISAAGNERSEARGRHVRIGQRATRSGAGGVLADIAIRTSDNSFESQVRLEADQVLALGQTGYAGRVGEIFPDAPSGTEASLYYVMTSDLGK